MGQMIKEYLIITDDGDVYYISEKCFNEIVEDVQNGELQAQFAFTDIRGETHVIQRHRMKITTNKKLVV